MGLFFRMNAFRTDRETMRMVKEPKSKYYRLVQMLAGVVLTLSILLMLLAMFIPSLNSHFSVILKATLAIDAICLGAFFCLPWINFLERNKRLADKGDEIPGWYKWVAIGFFAAIGVCVLLWIIAVFVVNVDTFKALLEVITGDTAETGEEIAGRGSLTFLATAIILSIQIGTGSTITASIFRYRKKYMTIRIISYVCIVIAELWVCWILGCIFAGKVAFVEDGTTHLMAPIDPGKLWLVIGILAVVGAFVSCLLLTNFVRRDRLRAAFNGNTEAIAATDEDFIQDTYVDRKQQKKENTPADKSVEEQLAKIKDLLDKGVITEEEYQEKRKEIISRL